jgi:transposase
MPRTRRPSTKQLPGRTCSRRPSDQDATSRPGVGLVSTQHSSGGKDRLGSIGKQGDRYLRSLFMASALAVIRYAKIYRSIGPGLWHC